MPRDAGEHTQKAFFTESVLCCHFCRIVFEDAAGLGFADVARELLLSSGCAILLDRPCPLDMLTLRLLLGCSARGSGQRDGVEASLRLWLHHLQGHQHHLFVVRRSGAVALLLQLCFGPYLRRQFRKAASHGPLTSTWPFLHLEEDLRPWPPPMLPCLQSLLSGSPPAHLTGKGPELEQAGKPISAPVVATACHSRAHASAVVVLVMHGSADETDFQSARKTLSAPPLGFVELLYTTDPAVIGDVMAPTSARPSALHPERVMPVSILRAGLGYSETSTSWCDKAPDGAARGLARVALFSRVCGGYEVKASAPVPGFGR
eukprot:s1421_g5.t1